MVTRAHELSVTGIMAGFKDLGVTEVEAKVIERWVLAKRTISYGRTPRAEEALRESQHEMKSAFQNHDRRVQVQQRAIEFYL